MMIGWGCCAQTRKPLTVIDIRDPVSSLELPRPSGSILANDKVEHSQSKSRKSGGSNKHKDDSKVALDLNALRAPRAIVHFDPQAETPVHGNRITPRAATPETNPELRPPSRNPGPRVHENDEEDDDTEEITLKIHKDVTNDDNASVISDNPLDYKHTKHSNEKYPTGSYSSSAYGTIKGPRVHEDPELGDEKRKPIPRVGYGTHSKNDAQLLAKNNEDNYGGDRTSSMDIVDLEQPKLKIHLSEDEDNENE